MNSQAEAVLSDIREQLDDTSNYRLLSIGIVAEDKVDDSKFIEVYPIESLPFFSGELNTETAELIYSGTDDAGNDYTVKLNAGITVKAGWTGSTNRRTSPNVRKGEQVELWTVGDTEEYFWRSMGRDDILRRREKVVWTWNASKETTAVDIEIDSSNHYSVTMDTINKVVALHTSKDNGEVASWDIELDTAEGIFTVADDAGNACQMVSLAKKITILNGDGSYLTVDRKTIRAYSDDLIQMDTKDLIVNAKGKIDITSGSTCNVTCGASYTNNTTGPYSVTAPTITMNGTFIVNGITALNGAVTASAGATILGGIKSIGNIDVIGNVKAAGAGIFNLIKGRHSH